MRAKYKGVMPVDEFFQSLYQDVQFFRKHNISHVKFACLYFTPCDPYGSTVVVRDTAGAVIDGYVSSGAYHSAFEPYETVELEPEPVARSHTVTRSCKNAF